MCLDVSFVQRVLNMFSIVQEAEGRSGASAQQAQMVPPSAPWAQKV